MMNNLDNHLATLRTTLATVVRRPDAPVEQGAGTHFSACPTVIVGDFGEAAIGLLREDDDGNGVVWTLMLPSTGAWPYAGAVHADGDLDLMQQDLTALIASGFRIDT